MIIAIVIPTFVGPLHTRMSRFQRLINILTFQPGVSPLAFTCSAFGAFSSRALGAFLLAPLALFPLEPLAFISSLAPGAFFVSQPLGHYCDSFGKGLPCIKGSDTVNRAPFSRPSLSTRTVPPCSSTRCLTIASPNPRPPCVLVVELSAWRNRSKT